jgi:beta-glucosidase
LLSARAAVFLAAFICNGAAAAEDWPWTNASLPPAQRAQLALDQMTEQEKLSLVHGVIAAPWGGEPKPAGSIGSAGYVAGVKRLGIPALQETDAELGVANPGDVRPAFKAKRSGRKRAPRALMCFLAVRRISFATREAAETLSISPRTRC